MWCVWVGGTNVQSAVWKWGDFTLLNATSLIEETQDNKSVFSLNLDVLMCGWFGGTNVQSAVWKWGGHGRGS